MIIEFADPGYNWLPIWIGVGVVLVTIGLMIALYPALEDAVAPHLNVCNPGDGLCAPHRIHDIRRLRIGPYGDGIEGARILSDSAIR